MIKKNDPRLTGYVLGELDATEMAEVSAAVDASGELQQVVAEISQATLLLDDVFQAEPALCLNDGQRQTLLQAIEDTAAAPAYAPVKTLSASSGWLANVGVMPLRFMIASAAAVLCLIVGGSLYFGSGAGVLNPRVARHESTSDASVKEEFARDSEIDSERDQSDQANRARLDADSMADSMEKSAPSNSGASLPAPASAGSLVLAPKQRIQMGAKSNAPGSQAKSKATKDLKVAIADASDSGLGRSRFGGGGFGGGGLGGGGLGGGELDSPAAPSAHKKESDNAFAEMAMADKATEGLGDPAETLNRSRASSDVTSGEDADRLSGIIRRLGRSKNLNREEESLLNQLALRNEAEKENRKLSDRLIGQDQKKALSLEEIASKEVIFETKRLLASSEIGALRLQVSTASDSVVQSIESPEIQYLRRKRTLVKGQDDGSKKQEDVFENIAMMKTRMTPTNVVFVRSIVTMEPSDASELVAQLASQVDPKGREILSLEELLGVKGEILLSSNDTMQRRQNGVDPPAEIDGGLGSGGFSTGNGEVGMPAGRAAQMLLGVLRKQVRSHLVEDESLVEPIGQSPLQSAKSGFQAPRNAERSGVSGRASESDELGFDQSKFSESIVGDSLEQPASEAVAVRSVSPRALDEIDYSQLIVQLKAALRKRNEEVRRRE